MPSGCADPPAPRPSAAPCRSSLGMCATKVSPPGRRRDTRESQPSEDTRSITATMPSSSVVTTMSCGRTNAAAATPSSRCPAPGRRNVPRCTCPSTTSPCNTLADPTNPATNGVVGLVVDLARRADLLDTDPRASRRSGSRARAPPPDRGSRAGSSRRARGAARRASGGGPGAPSRRAPRTARRAAAPAAAARAPARARPAGAVRPTAGPGSARRRVSAAPGRAARRPAGPASASTPCAPADRTPRCRPRVM